MPPQTFVGTWQLTNDKGAVTCRLTLNNDFTPKRSIAPDATGKWEVLGREARITWSNGAKDVLQIEKDGSARVYIRDPGVSWDDPPSNYVYRATKERTGAAAYDAFPEPLRSRYVKEWLAAVEQFKQLVRNSEESIRTAKTPADRRKSEVSAMQYGKQLAWLEKNQPPYRGPVAYDVYPESCRAQLVKDWDAEVTRTRNEGWPPMASYIAAKTDRERKAAMERLDAVMARIAALDWNDPPYLAKFFDGCKTPEEVARRAAERK